MANYGTSPEPRSKSKDKARAKVVGADRDKALRVRVLIKVGLRQRREQIKAKVRDKVTEVAGAVGIRTSESRLCRLMCGKALPFRQIFQSSLMLRLREFESYPRKYLSIPPRKGEAFPHMT